MKKQSRLSKRARVARATASAPGLALIMGLVNVAVGAEVSIKAGTSAPPTITASDSLATITPQYLNKSVEGTVTGAAFSNVSAGGTISKSGNIVAAEADGNKASSSTVIDLLDTTAGFSIISGQVVDLDGTQSVTAAIDGPLINVVFAAPVSDATLNGNTANAQATVNKSVASIAQANLQGFALPVSGDVKMDGILVTPRFDVTANGIIANYQKAVNAGGMTGSGASISAPTVVNAESTDSSLIAGTAITLSGNQTSASYRVNDSSSQYHGTGTAFDGSLAIANLQNNTNSTGTPSLTASIKDSGVTVSTGTNVIDGDITIAAQSFEATSGGNSADNRLVLDIDTGITGTTGGGSPSAQAFPMTLTANTEALAGIASAQGNDGAHLESSITDSNITVTGTGGTGTITLNNNNSLASANGNRVANTLSLKAGYLYEASGTIANAQANTGTTVAATNDTDISVAGAGGAIAHTGPVALSGNSIGSSAVGNEATHLTLVQARTSIVSTADTAAFFTISSQDSDRNSTFTATTDGDIRVDLLGADSANGLLADNTIDSSAKINVATNYIAINAGSGNYTAGVNNAQGSLSAASATTTGNMLARGEVNTVVPGSALTLSGNTLSASASGNEATNTSSNNVAGALTMNLNAPSGSNLLYNRQNSEGAITSAAGNVATALGIAATGASGSAGDVLGNALKSQAVANWAANTVALTAGTSLSAIETTKSTLYNYQNSRGSMKSTATGKVGIDVSAMLQDKANVIGNTLQATGTQNEAVNTLALTAGTTAGGRGSIESDQHASGATIVAVQTPGVGINMAAGSTGAATVSGNALYASASGNQAINDYSNTARTALETGAGSSLLRSFQRADRSIESAVGGITSPSVAKLGIEVAGPVGGSADVLGNTLRSVAVASSVQNAAALTAGTSLSLAVASTATLVNSQSSSASLVSTTKGSAVINAGDAISGKANVIDNTLQAIGIQNEALNRITLTAGTSISGAASIENTQATELFSNTIATVESDGVGIVSTGSISDQATVNGNVVQSQAIANLANNTLAIVSGTGSTADATITNKQTANNDVTASTSLTGLVGVAAGDSLGSTATVGSNRISALAFGNNAGNALNATGGAGVLNGNLSSSSTQVNRGAISATVAGLATGPTVGVSAATASVAGYTANLLGNRVSSTAYGNSAENVLNALSTGAISASAQLASSQTNTGAISARVTNAGMGISGVAGAPTVSGRSVISGNTISATAVGNSSVSQMVIGR